MFFSAALIFADALDAGEIFGMFSWFTLAILIVSLVFVRQKAVVPLFVAGLGALAVLFRFFEFISQAERIGAWLFILLIIEFVYLIVDLLKDESA
jgi:hypothetical protein